ncbi:hypothetical protein [Actinomadura sp. 9N215]|uniref:hypothetical protein n=1 Tax=Actinomadura sp. 9N215 TaxID=3375150 RepID=UPI0037B611FB
MSGVIDPNAIPIPKADPDAVEDAGRALKNDGTAIAQTGDDIHSAWQGLDAFYTAPHEQQLFAATAPIATAGHAFKSDVTTVGDALVAFAGEIRPLIGRLQGLKGHAQQFRSKIAGDGDWRKDEDKVNEHNQLNDDVLAALAQYQEAERDCANKITGVFGGTRFIPGDGDPKAGEKGYGLGDVPEGIETPWAKPQEYDAPWYEDAWNGVKDFGMGLVKDIADLAGLHGENGWVWEGDSHFWSNLGNNWKGVLEDTAGLVGLHGENGWVWEEDSHFWSNLGNNWKEVAHAFVPWREWGDRPGYVITNSVLNIATLRGVTKLLKRGKGDGDGGGDGDGDGQSGDRDGDGRLDNDEVGLNQNPTTQDLQNQLNDMDVDTGDLQNSLDDMDDLQDAPEREPAHVGGNDQDGQDGDGADRPTGSQGDDGPGADAGTKQEGDAPGGPDADDPNPGDPPNDPPSGGDPGGPPNDPPDTTEQGTGGGDPRDIPPEHFGDTDPKEPGPLGDKFRPGVHDPPDPNPDNEFNAKERETANQRADEGKLVTRLPVHPRNHDGFNSMDALERSGPDDPGTPTEYKDVGRNTRSAVDKALKMGFEKFDEQPDGTHLHGDIVIDGRRGDLGIDHVLNALKARMGRMLANGDERLQYLGRIETYLGDGTKVIYEDGRITHIDGQGEHLLGRWDPEAGRFVSPDDDGPGDPVGA